MMRPSSDLKTWLSEFEMAIINDYLFNSDSRRSDAAREEIVAFVGALEAEITARGKLYGEMCETLHQCCQKYKLGLGGENIAELVTEEVARLRALSGDITDPKFPRIVADPTVPRDELHVYDGRTGKLLGKITGLIPEQPPSRIPPPEAE